MYEIKLKKEQMNGKLVCFIVGNNSHANKLRLEYHYKINFCVVSCLYFLNSKQFN